MTTTDAGIMVGGITQVGIWGSIAIVFGTALVLAIIISKYRKGVNN